MNELYSNNSDEKINKIINKLDLVEDEELKGLILKLIEEHNNLINTIKIDPLTGAYNRRILNRIRDYTAVAICDIDNFKNINDTFGHVVGDKVLRLVAQTLMQNSRHNDYVCRFGGDEFVVVFCGASEKNVINRMKNILKSFENITDLGNLKITLSIGISNYNDGLSLNEAIEQADKALYVSKNSGKNLVMSYRDIKNNYHDNSFINFKRWFNGSISSYLFFLDFKSIIAYNYFR